MKLELTPALQLALERARQFAALAQASEVEPRLLLKGMLAEEEGKGVALLVQAGTDWSALQASLGLPASNESAEPSASVPFHQDSQAIMQDAGVLARLYGDEGSVATDHVLLALLTQEEALRAELEGFGMAFAQLQRSVIGDTEPVPMSEPLFLNEPQPPTDAARILDAAANRTREALRVLEDYARFVMEDAFLSGQLKQLRHDFAQTMDLLPAALLLASRDTLHDVGTAISTEQEWQRPSLQAVLQANAKRLQEGLRSLEEYGKVVNAAFAQQIEKIRYQSYTLERALVTGSSSRERLAHAQLYVLVTDALCRYSLVGTVKEALLGGAQIIQLREKQLPDRALLALASDLRRMTREHGALLIVNDRPDIALLADTDGVHLGQDDMPVQEARRLLGPDALIGVSTHNLEQVRQAVLHGANYLGVGPTFPSQSKDFEQFAGLEFVQQALAETSLPCFAIGGIQLDKLAELRAAGARRIAVCHAVCGAEESAPSGA